MVSKAISISSQGITKIPLPPQLELEINQIYLWHLAIPCQNNLQVYQEVLKAGIERLPNNSQINERLSQTDSNIDKIPIYASNGIWYETLELAMQYQRQLGLNNHLQTFNSLFVPEQ